MIKDTCYAANFIPTIEKQNDTNTFFDCVNKMSEKNLNLMTKSGLLFSCSKLQGICLSNQRAQNQGLDVALLPGRAEGLT